MLDGFEMNSGLLTLRFKSLLGKTFVTHFPGRMKELTRRGFADAVREIGLDWIVQQLVGIGKYWIGL